MAVPEALLGKNFIEVSNLFLNDRSNRNACLLIGIFRGEKMMLNPVGGEAGALIMGDELILLSPILPDLTKISTSPKN